MRDDMERHLRREARQEEAEAATQERVKRAAQTQTEQTDED